MILGLLALVLGAPTSPAAAESAPAPHGVYRFEAETMRRTGPGAITGQAGASKAKAMSLWANGAAYRMSTTTDAEQMVLRLRGDQCGGAPTARVDIDGTTVATLSVTATTWADHVIGVDLRQGDHAPVSQAALDTVAAAEVHLTRSLDG